MCSSIGNSVLQLLEVVLLMTWTKLNKSKIPVAINVVLVKIWISIFYHLSLSESGALNPKVKSRTQIYYQAKGEDEVDTSTYKKLWEQANTDVKKTSSAQFHSLAQFP